jgi:hypothetical protein
MKSNCLFVALTQKALHWQDVQLKVRWAVKTEIPHCYWYVRSKDKHFHFAAQDQHLSNHQLLWFKGRVERFHWAARNEG